MNQHGREMLRTVRNGASDSQRAIGSVEDRTDSYKPSVGPVVGQAGPSLRRLSDGIGQIVGESNGGGGLNAFGQRPSVPAKLDGPLDPLLPDARCVACRYVWKAVRPHETHCYCCHERLEVIQPKAKQAAASDATHAYEHGDGWGVREWVFAAALVGVAVGILWVVR